MKTSFLLHFVSVLFVAHSSSAEISKVVSIEGGKVAGFRQGTLMAYLGLPYAQSPVNDLRWKSPRRVNNWRGVRSAETLSPGCRQPFPFPANQSEDCLYLNIWTPARTTNSRLPVMVWIHGGGFQGGSGSHTVDFGQRLARHGVVVVTFNYRLGALGFMGHPLLSAESPHHVSGNYGLQDQIFALKWVRRNIRKFGGDPSNVTLFGESAGGASVATLMTSRFARGLFQKAIAQSGYDNDEIRDLRAVSSRGRPVELIGIDIEREVGCYGQRDLECLRQVSGQDIVKAASKVEPLGPSLDGFILRESPGQAFQAGRQARLPLIVGVMRDEDDASLYTSVDTKEKYREYLNRCVPPFADQIMLLYPAEKADEFPQQIQRLMSDLYATRRARKMSRRARASGQPVFLFQFTRVPPFALAAGKGAFHGLDVLYVFQIDFKQPEFAPIDFTLSDQIQTRWAAFAKNGQPNFHSSTIWPRFEAGHEGYLEFGDIAMPGRDLDSARLDLLDQVQLKNCDAQ